MRWTVEWQGDKPYMEASEQRTIITYELGPVIFVYFGCL